jgi:hypothetical protein
MSDELVHKMVMTSLMADDLEMIAYINANYEPKQQEPIASLSLHERSLRKPLNREFEYIQNMAKALDEEPNRFAEEGFAPAWLVRLMYKPNAALNQSAEWMENLVSISEGDPRAFADGVSDFLSQPARTQSIIPAIDKIVAALVKPEYSSYAGRIFDLNAKIALVNFISEHRSGQPENPYFGTDGSQVTVDDHRLCLDGPLPDERYMRCVATAL